MKTQLDMVKAFHKKFSAPALEKPTLLALDRAIFRHKIMLEELTEYLKGAESGDIVNISKELADILYTVFGTIHEQGLGNIIEEVFQRVHESNMSKDPSPTKAIKGPNYFEAKLEDLFIKKIIYLTPKNMKGFNSNIEKETLDNKNFRKVLYTGKHSQLVLMSLKPGEEIGMEIHTENDQFFRFEQGLGKVLIDGNEYAVQDGSAIVVPAGAEHNVVNISDTDELKLYTIYSPSHHKDGIVRATKEEAEANDEEFDGLTTE